MNFKKKLVTPLSLLALMLTGCASNDAQTPIVTNGQAETPIVSDGQAAISNHFYATLKHTDSGWRFVDFDTNGGGNMVNLKTGNPNWATSDRQCIVGLGTDRRSDHCDKVEKPDLFLTSSVNTGNAVMSVLVAPITFGLSATSVTKTVAFDRDKYHEALMEAWAHEKDTNLMLSIDDSLTDWKKERSALLTAYESFVNEHRSTLKKSITDESGLVDVSVFDLDSMVSISTHKLKQMTNVTGASLTELQRRIAKEKVLDLANTRKRFSTVNVECNYKHSLGGEYVTDVSCPTSAVVDTENKKLKGDVAFTILSVNKERVLPRHFLLKNKDIVLTLDGDKINIENTTNDYITIEQVSLYYLDDIALSPSLSIELPPQSRTTYRSALSVRGTFDVHWENLHYRNMTKQIAESETMNFGFAVKYKRSGVSHDDRAFSTKRYKLSQLL